MVFHNGASDRSVYENKMYEVYQNVEQTKEINNSPMPPSIPYLDFLYKHVCLQIKNSFQPTAMNAHCSLHIALFVYRRCLFILGIWSQLWCIHVSVLD
jgi:hypothetical protein